MLAKLSWRILKNPQCLLARCLLGKYCKEDSFLSIKPSKSSSHGWRGVLIGRDLLAKQLGWIVGTGADISIWNDPWLSSTEQLRPYGPAPEHLQDLKVSDLMRPDSTEWDTQALDLFLPCYKASIFLIKPSVCNAPNELVWLKTASGVYSTKSGYHAQSETSTQEEPTDHNGLPVGEQLSIRNIPIQNRCPRCNEMESVTHMLFHCTFVKDDWESAPLSSPVIPALLQNSGEALSLLRRIPSLPPVGLGPGSLQAWICWNIWISRNQLIFQKRSFSPAETLLKAIQEAREWTLAQAPTPLSPNRRSSIAFDPSTELFRTCMFTDAAWNPLTKSAGFGWIIDDAGSSSSHSAASLSVASPLVAEAMALRSAMISALNGGFNALHVFSDSQILINLVISKQRNLEIAVILTDIYLLIPLFHVIKFKAIPRAANDKADSIAKHALSSLYQP